MQVKVRVRFGEQFSVLVVLYILHRFFVAILCCSPLSAADKGVHFHAQELRKAQCEIAPKYTRNELKAQLRLVLCLDICTVRTRARQPRRSCVTQKS